MKLSVLMPVYNEYATLDSAIKEVLNVNFPCEFELVIVDDGSTDGTRDLFSQLADDPRISLQMHERNQGKGAAIRTAASVATGDYIIMCDADLEYDPGDIPCLLAPVLAGDAEVAYGTRSFGSHNSYSLLYVLGNRGVTMCANVMFNCYISDLETCFKLIPAAMYRELNITETGFGMEAEITGKLLKRGIRPYEVPISYKARTREAGKKLTWRDGVEAVWILTRIRLARRGRPAAAQSSARIGRIKRIWLDNRTANENHTQNGPILKPRLRNDKVQQSKHEGRMTGQPRIVIESRNLPLTVLPSAG